MTAPEEKTAWSLISADDQWALFALIAGGTALAIWLEQRFRWAARLSGPVIALLIAMLLSNVRIVPEAAAAYDFVSDWLVPLAIPLLLFRANLFHILGTTGRLFACFHIAAVGTLIGTVLAYLALGSFIDRTNLIHASGMMSASYIGGGVNFMAVKTSYSVSENVAGPLLVADNFVMAALFVTLLWMAASTFFRKRFRLEHVQDADTAAAGNLAEQHWKRTGISLLDIGKSLAIAFIVVALANLLGRATKAAFGDVSGSNAAVQMLQVLLTNKFVLLTTMSLVFATIFHGSMKSINGPEEIGTYFLYLFLFVIGLPANLISLIANAPSFLVFCSIMAVTNLIFTLVIGRVFRLPLEELVIAINATLGGPPSAAAMAISAGWPRLVLPGILVGIWGYVIGTPIGVFVIETLRRTG